MNLYMDRALAKGYVGGSQIARRLTEGWISANMYCPRCGNPRVEKCGNNKPVSDFICARCGNIFELKSKAGAFGAKVADGAYGTMIERITSDTNPDFMFLSYEKRDMSLRELVVVPRHFFVPAIIEKRPPLAESARRAGWIGCNILISRVPPQGRIAAITGGAALPRVQVVAELNRSSGLARGDIAARGWLFDVLNCVNALRRAAFTLADVYGFENVLADAHPENHNIRAKIRQQLQLLRDAGYIEFLGRGRYVFSPSANTHAL